MAFGITRKELKSWKQAVEKGEIAFLTHYWLDERFPNCHTVTKVGCSDIEKLKKWGSTYGLKAEWIDHKEDYPHYDLFDHIQRHVLEEENLQSHIRRFRL